MNKFGGIIILFSVFYGGFASSLKLSCLGISSLFMGPIVTFLIHLLLYFTLIKKYPIRINTKSDKFILFVILGISITILNTVLLIVTGRIGNFAA